MVAFIIALTTFAWGPGPTLENPYCYPVTNPTELLEGILLRNSPDDFRKLIRLRQPESGSFQEPFAPVGTLTWFGQILGLLPRQQCRIEIGKPEPVGPAKTKEQGIAAVLVNQLSDAKNSGKLKGFNIELNVETDGTVWLSGRVSNKEQKDLVLDIARRIRGVKQVVDDLTITERSKGPP